MISDALRVHSLCGDIVMGRAFSPGTVHEHACRLRHIAAISVSQQNDSQLVFCDQLLFFWRLLWYDETMKIAGITAEYNPFHKGHRYHIEKTREALEADCIIAVMSGNFTQRGEAAVMDKWTRSRIATEERRRSCGGAAFFVCL